MHCPVRCHESHLLKIWSSSLWAFCIVAGCQSEASVQRQFASAATVSAARGCCTGTHIRMAVMDVDNVIADLNPATGKWSGFLPNLYDELSKVHRRAVLPFCLRVSPRSFYVPDVRIPP